MTSTLQSARGATAFTLPEDFQEQLGDANWNVGDKDSAIKLAWREIIDQLLRIRRYSDDWDGEGSEAPQEALVDVATTLAIRLRDTGFMPADRVTAGVNATVTFEWFTPQGYIEIEVTSPLDAELRSVPHGATKAEVYRLVRYR